MPLGPLLRVGFLCGSVVLVVATKYPSPEAAWGAMAVVLGATTAISAMLGFATIRLRALRFVTFGTTLGLLVVPESSSALLASVHPALPALLVLLGLHLVFASESGHAPMLATGKQSNNSLHWLARFVPSMVAFLGIVLLPTTYWLVLDDRVRSAIELGSPVAALVPLLIIVPSLLVLGTLASVSPRHPGENRLAEPHTPASADLGGRIP